MSLGEFIQSLLVKKITGIKSDEEILEIFRVRLTKKERKLVKFFHDNVAIEVIKEELNCDDETLEKLKDALIKKLNQSKIKNELLEKNISK